MGGVWERMIRTIRNVMAGIAAEGLERLNSDSFRTILYEVTAIINSRSLTPSEEPAEAEPLTANHRLTMKEHSPYSLLATSHEKRCTARSSGAKFKPWQKHFEADGGKSTSLLCCADRNGQPLKGTFNLGILCLSTKTTPLDPHRS